MRHRGIVCAVALILSISPAVWGATHNIDVGNFFFSPTSTEIRPGDTVVWTLQSGTHTSTSDPSSNLQWDSGPMTTPGQTFEIMFTTNDGPGLFAYSCTFHPAMVDTLWAADTCWAWFDADADGLALSIADLLYLLQVLNGQAPLFEPYYGLDINGDCAIDAGDLDKLTEYILHGLSVFPHYPVPTCCYPDTLVGACCLEDSCSIRTEENCDLLGGAYEGDGTVCLPENPCICCIGSAGNVDNDPDDLCNIADLTALICWFFGGLRCPSPECPEESDIDGDGIHNIADLTYLVAYLFGGGDPPAACQ